MIYTGDCLDVLPTLPAESVQCVVTSPPYYGLRNYQVDGQIGLEATHLEYIEKMVRVFREVWRVLRPDGTLWLNLGDSYASGKGTCFNPGGNTSSFNVHLKAANVHPLDRGNKSALEKVGLKPKDLIGIPWRVAFALQADGWWLRQDIIWHKPNPMPESVKDRCCKSHEYVFLLTKSAKYYFDGEAIKEDAIGYDRSQNMGQEIQPDGQGESDFAKVLFLREGTSNETSLQGIPSIDGRTEGTIQDCEQGTRKTGEVYRPESTIPEKSEGQGAEVRRGQPIQENREGTLRQAEDRNQTQTSNQVNGLHIDTGPMEGNKGTTQSLLRILPPGNGTVGNGSCDTSIERGISYKGKHSTVMPEVQRTKGSKNIVGNMSERGVTRTTEGLNLKTAEEKCHGGKRARRSVWTITTKPFKEAHFATFPPEIPEICIKAGTSEKGCCPMCLAPWERVVEKGKVIEHPDRLNRADDAKQFHKDDNKYGDGGSLGRMRVNSTTGWRPTCTHNLEPIPCTVLDPFSGAGTTGLVAEKLGRKYIGIELNLSYVEMSENRIYDDCGGLPL